MEYEGLTRDHLANVEALNRGWLRCWRENAASAGNLTARLRDRVATAPFLLFSFREQDDDLWKRLLEKPRQPDLLDELPGSNDELHAVQITGLAFIWSLAWRNPYAARIISGAPSSWCERITSVTLMRVLQCTSGRHLIRPRLETTSMMHKGFAQIGAFQSMLTNGQPTPNARMKAAACRAPEIARQLADKV
jgi:hypothetical protein